MDRCGLLPFFILCFAKGVRYRHSVTWMSKGRFTCLVRFQSCPFVFPSLRKTHCTRRLPDTLLNAAPLQVCQNQWDSSESDESRLWLLLPVLVPELLELLACRYLGQKKVKEALDLLEAGTCTQLKHGQVCYRPRPPTKVCQLCHLPAFYPFERSSFEFLCSGRRQ